MRVISQNGVVDIPYEETVFISTNTVQAYTSATQPLCMAIYSTEERANKAMKMLRQAYMKCNSVYSDYIKGIGTVVSAACLENCIFQFPADNEVEP